MTDGILEIATSASKIVADAGGELVGRTKIQKIAFMLEIMDHGSGFSFEYKHYGPFSDMLSSALKFAILFDLIDEEEKPTSWGGFYSIYRSKSVNVVENDPVRLDIVNLGKSADAVELELAATAAFLSMKGFADAWSETEKRKPEKAASGRLSAAKELYRRFLALDNGNRLPAIA